MLVAYFTRDRVHNDNKINFSFTHEDTYAFQSTVEEWEKIFFVGAGMYIGPTIIFMIFGSGYVQKWNNILDEEIPDKLTSEEDIPDEVTLVIKENVR